MLYSHPSKRNTKNRPQCLTDVNQQYARSMSAQEYRQMVEKSISQITNPELKAYWTEQLDAVPNIFNLGYDLLGREGTTNYIYDKQKYIEHLNNYIMLNGTQEEQDAIIAISGITNAGMTLAEITALTALLGGDKTAGFIATTLMAGAPEGARLGLELTQQGMSYA